MSMRRVSGSQLFFTIIELYKLFFSKKMKLRELIDWDYHLLFFQIVVFISEPFMQFNNGWGARLARTYS